MQTHSFRASSMSEALSQVKRELGTDAVIVSTRTTRRGGVMGMGSRTITEITAHANEPSLVMERSVSTATLAPAKPRAAADQPGSVARAAAEIGSFRGVGPADDRLDDSTMLYRIDRANAALGGRERSARGGAAEPLLGAAGTDGGMAVPSRIESAARPLGRDAVQLSGTVGGGMDPAVREELNALRSMMGQMLRGQRTRPQPRMSDPLFDVYLKLIESEVADEIADEVVGEVRDVLDAASLRDPAVVREAVLERLTRLVPISQQPSAIERDPRGRPYTIAFVGPTGVGKTTTLAKLAATLKLREGKKVGLITCDTYRIAAVDQLRTYASIIGLPIRVALTPAEVEQACEALSDCDAILIDTAGRSPKDTGRIEELQRFIGAGRPHEVHLVLSSAASVSVLDAAVEKFGAIGPDHVIFTKIDEAVNFGVLLGVVGKVNAKLSFITTGQEVPEHIERCDPRRIAELVLGGERVA